MVEYHGWVNLSCSTGATESDDHEERAAFGDVSEAIQRIAFSGRELQIRYMNGSAFMWCSGCTNHWSADVQEVLDLYRFIAGRARGSYGLLYVHNDEDPLHENEFQVWTLAKGQLRHQVDRVLSPCIPTIEDPEAEQWLDAFAPDDQRWLESLIPSLNDGRVRVNGPDAPWFECIKRRFPVDTSGVMWGIVPGAVAQEHAFPHGSPERDAQVRDFIRLFGRAANLADDEQCVVIGDMGTSIALETTFRSLIDVAATLASEPQGTLVVVRGGDWCLVFTMIGTLYFGPAPV